MPAYQTRTNQFGLVSGIQQTSSDLIANVEPGALFAPEARKGQLHLLVEGDRESARNKEACQLVVRTLRKVFYEDSSLSLTSSLRDSLRVANKTLYQHNFATPPAQRASVGLSCAVLRGGDLYIAQVAPCQAYVFSQGKLRALPSHLPAGSQSAHAASRLGALGTSLSVEPELYRCNMHPGDSLLLCSSNMARVIAQEEIERALRYQDPSAAISSLLTLCRQHGLSEAHAFVLELLPPLSPAARSSPLSPGGVGERVNVALRSVGDWFAGLTGEAVRATRKQGRSSRAAEPDSRELIHPEGLIVDPTPLPRPIELGERLDERVERQQEADGALEQRHEQERDQRQRRRVRSTTAASTSELEQPPSSFLGELDYSALRHRRVELPDDSPQSAPSNPFRPQHELRPLIDMTWGERLMFPFQRINESLSRGVSLRIPRNRASLRAQSQQSMPPVRGKGLSYRRQSPPFPWLRLALLLLLVAVLILYGVNLSRSRADQDIADYLTQAEQRMASVRAAPDDATANDRLDKAREAIDQVRASPLITVTNLDTWPRYQELEREYERAQSALQRLSYVDDAKVLSTHPSPTGRFSTLIVPPSGINITDTTVLRYVYALDGSKDSGQVYRIPLAGGTPELFLKAGDSVANVVSGPIRALAWREDNVVAVDQANSNFSYYFRSEGAWSLSQLAGSDLWSPKERLDIETYDGNLYVWGAEQGQLLKYTSGHYADLPIPWIAPDRLDGHDLTSALDMAVDGNVYLLQPNGAVEVLSGGAFDHEVVPEPVTPPITAVTRFFVTGASSDSGNIFLVDTPNERIIQIDKISGKLIQQIRTRPDDPVRFDQLIDVVVDMSSRPILFIVNGGQIIRAELPTAPRPLRSTTTTPTTPTPTVVR